MDSMRKSIRWRRVKKRKAWWIWPPSQAPAVKHDRRAASESRLAEYLLMLRSGEYELRLGEDGRPHIWRKRKADQPRCGAKTRAGGLCQMRVVSGKRRCRLHGGLSTGPKTEAGREAIRESNRRRSCA